MKEDLTKLTVVDVAGRQIDEITSPAPLPTDLVPGEFLMIPDNEGRNRWYVFSDKQRFWGNNRWNLSGSIYEFDPSSMSEKAMYALRRKLLKQTGWID